MVRRTGLVRGVAGLGLLLLIGPAVLGGLAGCGRGVAAPPATPTAARAVAVTSALPAPADLGAGWRPAAAGVSSADWPWALAQCVLFDAADYPAVGHREAARRQAYAGPPGQAISVTVERFQAGWAARSMDDVRRVLDVCVRYEHNDASGDFLDSHTMTLKDFAGDDSLMVETVRIGASGPAESRFTAVVRRGDLILTIVGVGVPQERLPRLARLLASRI